MNHLARMTIGAAVTVLAACATTPDTIPELDEARARVQTLEQNPLAQQAASRDLTASRGALAQAEQALQDRQDRERIVHLAYLAEQRAELGLARVDEAESRQRIEQAEAERDKVLLESREAKARAAEQAAQAAEQAAQASQSETLQARAELESLQQQYAALAAKKTDRGMVMTLGDVLFDTDEATLKPGATEIITRLADFLTRNETTRIRVEGHTDSTGDDAYNTELSRRRAQAVADALMTRSIPANRVEVIGRGEGFPVATNDTSAGRQQNRRVEIIFSDPEGELTAMPQS
ncbi:MAG TPA: OmpA family protein [Steroidobacteraceae bacterium]|jgi:outer membrane protein OmpA-like peptidoglycan-associated protein|nr:OmpA family protein [Steroidobacteraceae bacterium]